MTMKLVGNLGSAELGKDVKLNVTYDYKYAGKIKTKTVTLKYIYQISHRNGYVYINSYSGSKSFKPLDQVEVTYDI